VADKAETGKSPPAERKTVVGIPAMAAASQRIETSAGYSSSFDLGMTQPGSLTTWRLSGERARQPADAACQLQPPPNHAAENQTQTLEQRKHEPAIFHQHFGIECTSEAFVTTETKRSVVAV